MNKIKGAFLAGIVAAQQWNVTPSVRFYTLSAPQRFVSFDVLIEADAERILTDRETIMPECWTDGENAFLIGYGPKSNVIVLCLDNTDA